jgi:hypothetical protein
MTITRLTAEQRRALERWFRSRSPRGKTYLHIEAFRLCGNAFCSARRKNVA